MWIINTHNGYTNKNGQKIQAIDIEQYPTLKTYFNEVSKNHNGKGFFNRDDKGITPYNLRSCAYLEEFEKEKIVYPNMNKEFITTFDKQAMLTNQKCFILTSNTTILLKYLIAILNSKLNFYYFKQIGATLGASGYEMSKIFVEKLPIPKITKVNQNIADEIIKLVDKILESKAKDSKANTKELESQIDSLIYKLYNLTDDEIKIIEM